MYDCAATQRYNEVFDVLSEDRGNEPQFVPYGAAYHGHDGFREMIGHVTKVLDVAKMRVLRTIADGDRVIAILEMSDLATVSACASPRGHWFGTARSSRPPSTTTTCSR
jgi:hypothetical protein